ncbi:hypothetical protein HU200_035028 [Digitaria exilis]|uniref:Dof zinc finger protein n=1 Tax=Digitaria exilis TaxID=1010633 RepID=A0A835BUK4_9POAL|nr:hypothetical protein HU200_035028 [Digitaria exilis]
MARRSSADMPAESSVSVTAGDAGYATSSSSSWVIKPGCMMELARLAKIPQPESGLMCPRCHSTETKFCYYNNYSLSQPRHLCRTCRRYWTHGGALRDLPFSTTVRRRRRRGKSSSSNNNKHDASLSKVASCASGNTGRAAASSSSSSAKSATVSGGGVAVATAIMQQDPVIPLVYRHQHRYLWQQRQPLSSFLGYKNCVSSSAAATTSAICPFVVSEEAGGGSDEAGSFAAGQMQDMSCRRVPASSPAVVTTELASVMMTAAENQPVIIPCVVTEMMGTLASSPSPGVGLQGESSDVFRFLGSGSSWACGYGFTAGNGSVVGGKSCTVAPGNLWSDPSGSGFTSSSSGRTTSTIL